MHGAQSLSFAELRYTVILRIPGRMATNKAIVLVMEYSHKSISFLCSVYRSPELTPWVKTDTSPRTEEIEFIGWAVLRLLVTCYKSPRVGLMQFLQYALRDE